MKADTLNLQAVFYKPIRYRVPMFQRPYVWTKERQWEPLWEDMRELAERLLDASPHNDDTPHFIGAVVLEQVPQPLIKLESRSVIDGQQRLTTIQVLISAARTVAEECGASDEAELLGELIWNDTKLAKDPRDRLKVEPTEYDRAAFEDVMEGLDASFHPDSDGALIRAAFRYFRDELRAWTSTEELDPSVQLEALRQALWKLVQVVVIDLDRDDNAQMIFETLNARGTPLLAADLVKNLLFRTAMASGEDASGLYDRYWRPLDGSEWRRTIRQGRLFRPRIDVFVMHWLTMTLGKEVVIHQLYPEFRAHLRSPNHSAAAVLADLREFADVYAAFDSAPPTTAKHAFFYRLDQLDTTTAMPALLWMFGPHGLAEGDQALAMGVIESWLVRRMLCRLTTRNYNVTFLALLTELRSVESPSATTVIEFFRNLTTESQYWPDDEAVSAALMSQPVYQTQSRKRLRMLLEALEQARGSDLTEQVQHSSLTVEHILPQKWGEHWPLATDEPDAVLARDQAKHLIGNLTLVTKALNPSMSNAAWPVKRQALNDWSVLLISADARTADTWDESAIRARTYRLSEDILKVWPGPESNEWGTPLDPERPRYAPQTRELDLPTPAVTTLDVADRIPDSVIDLIDGRSPAAIAELATEFANIAARKSGVSLRLQNSKYDPNYFQVRSTKFSQVVAYVTPGLNDVKIEYRLPPDHPTFGKATSREGFHGIVLHLSDGAELDEAIQLLDDALEQPT